MLMFNSELKNLCLEETTSHSVGANFQPRSLDPFSLELESKDDNRNCGFTL